MQTKSFWTPTKRWLTCGLGALALGSCAPPDSKLEATAVAVNPGPSFLVHGRLSIRQVGRQSILGAFSWGRGPSAKGWSERIKMFDNNGSRILNVISTPEKTSASTPRRSYVTKTLDELLAREIGLRIAPRMLAGWLNNEHDGQPLPDLLQFDKTQVKVLSRNANKRPLRLQIVHDETIIVVSVSTYSS